MNLTRNQVAIGVALLIVAGALLFVYLRIEDRVDDPLAQRRFSERLLQRHAQVLEAYRAAHDDAWPADYRTLAAFSRELAAANEPDLRLGFGANVASGGGVYRYRAPAGDGPDSVVMASDKAHPALPIGTPLEDGPAEAAIPAVHYVLRADLSIDTLSETEQRRQVPWVYAGAPAEERP